MSKISNQINETLKNINDMVIAAKILIDYIEENPESLIRGKPQRPIVQP